MAFRLEMRVDMICTGRYDTSYLVSIFSQLPCKKCFASLEETETHFRCPKLVAWWSILQTQLIKYHCYGQVIEVYTVIPYRVGIFSQLPCQEKALVLSGKQGPTFVILKQSPGGLNHRQGR